MQITVNSTNIQTFGFTILFDIANQKVIFDIASLTVFNGSGGTLIQGINFAFNDSSGNPLISGNYGNGQWDWDNPNITVPSTDANPDYSGESTYVLDLTQVWGNNYQILFQQYFIQGAIKDEFGQVYQTAVAIQDVCQPTGLTDLGYVVGDYVVKADCQNSLIRVTDVTNVSYNKKLPITSFTNGQFYYPQGTITVDPWVDWKGAVNAAYTTVFTGNYTVTSTRQCTYDFGNSFSVLVEYYVQTDKYNITCEKHMLSVMCCVTETQDKIVAYCGGSDAAYWQGKMNEAIPYLWIGLQKEASGRDSAGEALKVREILKCKCNNRGVRQIAPNPVNPLVYNIVIEDEWATEVIPSVIGNTKTWTVRSPAYIVGKKVPTDTNFYVDTDTSVAGVVTYKLYFNYDSLALQILNTIGGSQTLLTQFNSLVWNNGGGLDISSINGRCVLDISSVNYFLSYRIPVAATTYKSIRVNGADYVAPPNILVSNEIGAESWLNGLSLGVYETTFSAGTGTSTGSFFVNILSLNNAFVPESVTFTNAFGDTTISFQKVTKNILALLQAMINYMCDLDATKIKLGTYVNVCYFDYNGDLRQVTYTPTNTQADLNAALASAQCTIANKIGGTPTCVPINVVGEVLFPDAVAGVPYNYTFDLSGTQPFTIQEGEGFPEWVSISLEGNQVTVSGTPEDGDEGVNYISFRILNCGGDYIEFEEYVTVTVECVPLGVISGLPLPDGIEDELYSTSVVLSGTGPYSLNIITKPVWMTISMDGNVVTLVGTPTDPALGEVVNFTVSHDCGDGIITVDEEINISDLTTLLVSNQIPESYQTIAINSLTVDNSNAPFNLPIGFSCGNLQQVSGTHTGWSGVLRVYFTPSPIGAGKEMLLRLKKNGVIEEGIFITDASSSPAVFLSTSFLDTDVMIVDLIETS